MQHRSLRDTYTSYTVRRLFTALTLPYMQRTPYSGPVQRLSITTSDGVILGATLLSRNNPDLIIICHGVASNQGSQGIVWLAESLVGPWDVLTFDWRGYGRSGGLASFGGDEALDLVAVLNHARHVGYRRIGVIGESMGGLIVLATLGALALDGDQLADMRYPDRVATLAAPGDYKLTGWPRPTLMRYVAPYAWARPLAPFIGFRMGVLKIACPLDVVSNIHVPLLMTHGDQDTTVPVCSAYMLHERIPTATLRIYEGVEHGVEAMRMQVPQELLHDLRSHFHAMESAQKPAQQPT